MGGINERPEPRRHKTNLIARSVAEFPDVPSIEASLSCSTNPGATCNVWAHPDFRGLEQTGLTDFRKFETVR